MSGVVPFLKGLGPATYPVGAPATAGAATVKGGQLVAVDGTDATKVNVADGSTPVLGVALYDAAPIPDQSGDQTGYGQPIIDISVPPGYVAVAYGGVDIPVTYANTAALGDLLKAAAGGQVTPYVSGTDTDATLIVGRCTQPGGVTAGAVGRARITV